MKKIWMLLIPVLTLVLAFGIAGTGCKKKETASPVAPAVPTNTPLPVDTNTPTHTFTFTFTATPTVTNTPIFSFTFTHTPTITPTFTHTLSPTLTFPPTDTLSPTLTFTPTDTLSPTPTATVTPTATPCVAALKETYAFDADTECWYVNENSDADTAPGCQIAWSGVTFQTGPGGMAVSATFSGALQQKFQVEILWPTHHNIAGYTFRFRTLYSAAARGSAGYGAVQPFVQNGTSWDASWISLNSTQLAAWTTSSWVIPTNANTQDADKVGIQVYIGANGGPGWVYIDQVELIPPPTPTPTHTLPPGITPTETATFTPTATSCTPVFQATYAFNTSSECWAVDSTLPAVMGWSGTTYDVGPGGMAVSVGFNPLASGEQDATVQIDFASPYVNLTGAYISFRVRYSPEVLGTATYGAVQAFVQDDAWSFNDNYIWASAASLGSFATYHVDLTQEGGNQAAIRRVGAKFIVGPGAGPGVIYVDEVHITLPAGTPTPTATPVSVISNFDSTAEGWVGCTLTGYVTPTSEGWTNTDGFTSAGCFQISFPALGADEFVGVRKVFGTPQDWSGAATLRVAVRVANGQQYYAGGTTAYINSDSDSDANGACVGTCWTNQDPASGWIFFAWPLTGITDLTTVNSLTVRFNTGGGGSSPIGDMRIDDVVLY